MAIVKTLAIAIVVLYAVGVLLLYLFQTKLIFIPEKLPHDFKFSLRAVDEELFLTTADGEKVNALFYRGHNAKVILYLHGNAGSLKGWQYVAEDFVKLGYSILILDYRGYGKSTGTITEAGLYLDAQAAYDHLKKSYSNRDIIVYGRSIGTGVAVTLASKHAINGLILEAPYSSLHALANEKLPMFFPSLYLKTKLDNLGKINRINCPLVLIHGSHDTLIPASHSHRLYQAYAGKKELVIVAGGAHNDLIQFPEYRKKLEEVLQRFF